MNSRKRQSCRSPGPRISTDAVRLSKLSSLHPALPRVLHRLASAREGRRKLEHSLRVASAVQGPTARRVALLHDVIETTSLTPDDLRRLGFSSHVVRRVELLSRRRGEPYMDYIRRLMTDPIARRVKLADLADNAARLRALVPRSARARSKLRRNVLARRLLQAASGRTARRERSSGSA